jgi:hypothetical protein
MNFVEIILTNLNKTNLLLEMIESYMNNKTTENEDIYASALYVHNKFIKSQIQDNLLIFRLVKLMVQLKQATLIKIEENKTQHDYLEKIIKQYTKELIKSLNNVFIENEINTSEENIFNKLCENAQNILIATRTH